MATDTMRERRERVQFVQPAAALEMQERDGVFQRSFAVLELIVRKGRPVTPVEIAESLNLPKPTVYRLIDSFERQGFVRRQFGSKRVTVGARLTDLAFDILRASIQHAPRRVILEGVVMRVGETCNVGTLDSNEIVYLDRVEATHWPLRLHLGVGSRVPLHCTAIGKLFLAFLPVEQRERLLGSLELRAFTPSTIIKRDQLDQELASIRKDKLSIDREEYLAGVICAAWPIFDQSSNVRAGIAIQAPVARLPVSEVGRHRELMMHAAEQLSSSFNFE